MVDHGVHPRPRHPQRRICVHRISEEQLFFLGRAGYEVARRRPCVRGLGGYPVAEHFVFLGLEPEACELATALQARFDQGKFKVSTRYKADEGILDMIVTLLLSVWAFKRWTESRWLSMGPSCRIMLSALALGLDTFVRWCLRQPGQSRYFLGGFEDYFSPQVAVLIAVIGTSSFVADAALNCLLEDDRLATRITVLESDMLDELRFISGIDDKIWAFFGRLADTPGRLLKHQALSSSFIAAGHIKWRLRYIHQPPWSLCRGGILASLAAFRDGSIPSEPTSHKIYVLAKMGYSPALLKQGLELLANTSFSSVLVEEAHKYSSSLMKLHSQHSQGTVAARSMVASAAPLVSSSSEQNRNSTIEKTIKMLERKRQNVRHIGGRQAYVKDLVAVGATMQRMGRRVRSKFASAVIRQHSSDWHAMHIDHKRHFMGRATELQERTTEVIDGRVEELRAQRKLLLERSSSERLGLPPLRMSSAKLSAAQRHRLECFSKNCGLSHKDVEEARSELQPFGPPPESCRMLLESMELPQQPAGPARPSWLTTVALHRAFFCDAIFRFTTPDMAVAYAMFLFARQAQPMMAGFIRLCPLAVGGGTEQIGGLSVPGATDWSHNFSPDYDTWIYNDAESFQNEWDLDLLVDCVRSSAMANGSPSQRWQLSCPTTLATTSPPSRSPSLARPTSKRRIGSPCLGSSTTCRAIWGAPASAQTPPPEEQASDHPGLFEELPAAAAQEVDLSAAIDELCDRRSAGGRMVSRRH